MDLRNLLISREFVAVAVSAALLAAAAARAEDTGRSFEIYGFVQADYIQDITGRLDPDWTTRSDHPRSASMGRAAEDGQASISVNSRNSASWERLPTGSNSAPLNFKFEFDLVRHRCRRRPDHFPTASRVWRVGHDPRGPDQQLFMDGDVFPNTIDYWGPSGMVFYRNVQIRLTPWRTENSHFAIASNAPAMTSTLATSA